MPWHGFKAVIPALLKTFIKQAGDTETNTKLATRTFWVKVHVHIKKACGRRSGADCMSTFVCQPCKQPKWLSHPQAAGLVCSRPRLRWLPLIFFFSGEDFQSCNKTSHISSGTSHALCLSCPWRGSPSPLSATSTQFICTCSRIILDYF